MARGTVQMRRRAREGPSSRSFSRGGGRRGKAMGASSFLRRLQRLKAEYGPGRARPKLELLSALERRALPYAREVLRLHETLCFLRAYPDDATILARVGRMPARL